MSLDASPAADASEAQAVPKRAVLLVNTKSRRGKEWFGQAQDELRRLGVEVESAKSFKRFDDLIRGAKEAIGRGVPMLIVGGGDGTFNGLADLVVNTSTVVGILPLGTGNSLARDLGIVADVARACDVIVNGKVVSIDLGWANGTHFVNVATVGLTTKIAQNLTNDMKKRLGRFVYAVAIFRAMKTSQPFKVSLETENGQREFECLQVVIGNGKYHAGPFPISPEASIVAGKLSVYAVKGTTKWALIPYALSLPGGRQTALQEVYSEQCQRGRLTTTPPMEVTVDGEVCSKTPFEFHSVPRSMRVAVPADWQG